VEYRYTYTPKFHISRKQSMSYLGHTRMQSLLNLCGIQVYVHLKNTWHHIKRYMQSSRLSIYICSITFKLIGILICLVWNPSVKTCHTPSCYACSCYVSWFYNACKTWTHGLTLALHGTWTPGLTFSLNDFL